MNLKTILTALCLTLVFFIEAYPQKLSLEQVIKEVCVKSDSAKLMQETLTKSQQTVRQNRSAALPTISATVTGMRLYGIGVGLQTGQSSTPVLDSAMAATPVTYGALFSSLGSFTQPSAANLYKAEIQFSQPIYTFGKIGTAIKVAGQYDKSIRSSNKRSMQQLQLTAVDAFYGVLLSGISLEIAQRSLNRKKELYEFLERNFSLGSGSKAQVLAAKADMRSQVPVITIAQEALLSARMSLNMLMGHALSDTFTLDTVRVLDGLISTRLPSEKEALETALTHREDLHALQFLAEATKGGAKIFNSMYLPSIAATGALGSQAATPEDVNWDNRTWSIGLAMQWNIFDGFQNNARARQYRSDAQKLQINHDAFSKLIEINIATAIAECVGADSNLVAVGDALAAARESYELTNENFHQGSGQLVDLQDAENRLRLAEMGYVSAQYRQVRSHAALQIAMGNYIVPLEDK